MLDPEHVEAALTWLRYADEDLALAEQALVPRLACSLAQQAAEKALKAALVVRATDFPRTHDLVRLRRLLPASSPAAGEAPDLGTLSQLATEARYPGDWDEPVAEEAAEALAAA
jgi:HEPN domain-containing protein